MNSPLPKKVPVFIRTLVFFTVTFVLLSAGLSFFSQHVTGWMVPAYAYVIEKVYPENELVSIENAGAAIMYTMKIHKKIQGTDLPLVDYLVDSIHAGFQFVTMIIYYSLLFAWPSLALSKRM